MNYIQARININPDNELEMRAYEILEKMGRKRSQYVINLILNDISDNENKINHLLTNNSKADIQKELSDYKIEVSQIIDALRSRIEALENRESVQITEPLNDMNHSDESNSINNQMIEDDSEDIEEPGDEIPVIPPDIASRLGSF